MGFPGVPVPDESDKQVIADQPSKGSVTIADAVMTVTGDRMRDPGRWLLGAALLVAGMGHLGEQREEFRAQVPEWFPIDADLVVVASGVVEIVLGLSLIVLTRHRVVMGWVVAAFFVVIFPGNIAQFVEGTDAFGLESDTARFVRLLFQPLLVVWALWSTGAWRAWRGADAE